jgi:hypothetical protein
MDSLQLSDLKSQYAAAAVDAVLLGCHRPHAQTAT